MLKTGNEVKKMEGYTYMLLTLGFLFSTFINVTVAGFLTLKMFEFIEKKLFELETNFLKAKS